MSGDPTSTSTTNINSAAAVPYLEVSNPELPPSVTKHHLHQSAAVTVAANDDDNDDRQEEEDDDDEGSTPRSGCGKFWARWKYVFILIGFQFLMGISGIVLNPILPGIKRRYFGSDKEAAFYSTIMRAVSSAIALVLCPISGYAMDFFGRRPFFLGATALNMVAPVMLLAFFPNPLPFMIASSVSMLVTASYGSTYVADHYQTDSTRMMAFAFVIGAGSISTAFGFVVTAIPEEVCVIISVAFAALALVYVYFLIQESLPKEKLRGGMQSVLTTVNHTDGTTSTHEEFVLGGRFEWSKVENPWKAMKAVLDSKITIVTVIIMGMFTVSQTGVGEVYFYYLNEKVGFAKGDNALVLLEAGTMWPFVMFAVIPFAKKFLKLHSITIVMFSVCCLAGEMTIMCLVNAKWQIFAIALPMAAMVNMSFPALTTVIADGSTGEDQGRRQAGLAAIGDFFGTLAPLFFGLIYSHTNAFWSFLPFAIAAVLTVPTFVLTYKLRHWLVVLGQRNCGRSNSAAPTPRSSSHHFVEEEEENVAASSSAPLLQDGSGHAAVTTSYDC